MKPSVEIMMGLMGAVLVLGVLWFVLIRMLFKRLEARHAAVYDAMGRPTLFRRNNLRTNLSTMKFLLAREHRALEDPGLSRLADAMLVFTIIYVVAALGLVAYMLSQQAAMLARLSH